MMNYLFVVAHPDDESDAAGGTINKLIKEGKSYKILDRDYLESISHYSLD